MKYFRVRNWERFQHYKKRSPPWIKLYTALLDDPDFAELEPEQRWCLIGLMLLASKFDNRIPNRPNWLLQKLGANPSLKSLSHWIVTDDASDLLEDCLQDASETLDQSKRQKQRQRHKDSAPDGAAADKPPRKLSDFQKILEHFKSRHLEVMNAPYVAEYKRDNGKVDPHLKAHGLDHMLEMVDAFWQEKEAHRNGDGSDNWIGKHSPSIPGFCKAIPQILDHWRFKDGKTDSPA